MVGVKDWFIRGEKIVTVASTSQDFALSTIRILESIKIVALCYDVFSVNAGGVIQNREAKSRLSLSVNLPDSVGVNNIVANSLVTPGDWSFSDNDFKNYFFNSFGEKIQPTEFYINAGETLSLISDVTFSSSVAINERIISYLSIYWEQWNSSNKKALLWER